MASSSTKFLLVILLMSFVAVAVSVPIAPLSPDQEALLAEPKAPSASEVTEPAKETEKPVAKNQVTDAANAAKTLEAPAHDLDTANTFLLGLGFPGWYGGPGVGLYGLPYAGFGGYGYGGYGYGGYF